MSRTARILYGLTLLVIAVTAVIGWRAYPGLPERIPTHFGPSGAPDRWSDKGFWPVFGLLVMMVVFVALFAMIGGLLGRHQLPANPDEPTSSVAARTAIARRMGTEGLAGVALLLTVFICIVNVLTWHSTNATPPPWTFGALTAAVLVGIFAALAWSFRRSGAAIGELEDDPEGHWKGGLFYVNRDDPRALVPKRFGYGWSPNLGRPSVQLVTALFILLIIGLIVLSLTAGR